MKLEYYTKHRHNVIFNVNNDYYYHFFKICRLWQTVKCPESGGGNEIRTIYAIFDERVCSMWPGASTKGEILNLYYN